MSAVLCEYLSALRCEGGEVGLLLGPQRVEDLGVPARRPAFGLPGGDDDERHVRQGARGLDLLEARERIESLRVVEDSLAVSVDLLLGQMLLELLRLERVVGFHEDHAGHVVRVGGRIQLRDGSAKGEAHEDIRRSDLGDG